MIFRSMFTCKKGVIFRQIVDKKWKIFLNIKQRIAPDIKSRMLIKLNSNALNLLYEIVPCKRK